jgi:hypothetical protein
MKHEITPYLSEWQKAVYRGVGVEAIRSISPTSEKLERCAKFVATHMDWGRDPLDPVPRRATSG